MNRWPTLKHRGQLADHIAKRLPAAITLGIALPPRVARNLLNF
jgi:hypothetical protein